VKRYIYGLFDVANSPFQALIISTIFAPYFAQAIVGDPEIGSAYWQWTVGLCAILIAIVGIKLGPLSDTIKHGRRNFFFITTLLCITFTFFLWGAKPKSNYIIYTLVIFFIANFFFELSQMFYNSYLFNFSEKKERGAVSGFAFALGYFVVIPLILFLVIYFLKPQITLFNLDKTQFEHIRIIPIIVGVWFLFFSIPIFMSIYSLNPAKLMIKSKIQSSLDLIFKKKKITNLGRFLIARLFYADAIIALQVSFAVFTKHHVGLTFEEMLKLLLLTSFVQGLGAFFGGIVNDRIGSKKIIQISLVVVFFTIIGLVSFKSKFLFVLIFEFGAFFFGILQSASRVLMTSFLNKDNLGQGFGLFTLASRSTAILGPIMIGTITYFTSVETGFLSITVLLLIGYVMLKKVDVPRSY
jgi:UMF1 family MFS transporter